MSLRNSRGSVRSPPVGGEDSDVDPDLMAWLREIRCEQYSPALAAIGCDDKLGLLCLDADSLESIGFRTIHRRKFLVHLAALHSATAEAAEASRAEGSPPSSAAVAAAALSATHAASIRDALIEAERNDQPRNSSVTPMRSASASRRERHRHYHHVVKATRSPAPEPKDSKDKGDSRGDRARRRVRRLEEEAAATDARLDAVSAEVGALRDVLSELIGELRGAHASPQLQAPSQQRGTSPAASRGAPPSTTSTHSRPDATPPSAARPYTDLVDPSAVPLAVGARDGGAGAIYDPRSPSPYAPPVDPPHPVDPPRRDEYDAYDDTPALPTVPADLLALLHARRELCDDDISEINHLLATPALPDTQAAALMRALTVACDGNVHNSSLFLRRGAIMLIADVMHAFRHDARTLSAASVLTAAVVAGGLGPSSGITSPFSVLDVPAPMPPVHDPVLAAEAADAADALRESMIAAVTADPPRMFFGSGGPGVSPLGLLLGRAVGGLRMFRRREDLACAVLQMISVVAQVSPDAASIAVAEQVPPAVLDMIDDFETTPSIVAAAWRALRDLACTNANRVAIATLPLADRCVRALTTYPCSPPIYAAVCGAMCELAMRNETAVACVGVGVDAVLLRSLSTFDDAPIVVTQLLRFIATILQYAPTKGPSGLVEMVLQQVELQVESLGACAAALRVLAQALLNGAPTAPCAPEGVAVLTALVQRHEQPQTPDALSILQWASLALGVLRRDPECARVRPPPCGYATPIYVPFSHPLRSVMSHSPLPPPTTPDPVQEWRSQHAPPHQRVIFPARFRSRWQRWLPRGRVRGHRG